MKNFSYQSARELINDINDQYSFLFRSKLHFLHNVDGEELLMRKQNKNLQKIKIEFEKISSKIDDDSIKSIFNIEFLLKDLIDIMTDYISLDFDNIINKKYYSFLQKIKNIYDDVEILSLNLQKLYNHVFVYIKDIYSRLRSDIEKDIIMNDNFLYKECLNILISNHIDIGDYSYKNVCNMILFCLNFKRKLNKKKNTISYYDMRSEETTNLWSKVKQEFFEIAYSPDIVKKTVWNDQETEYYKNMFVIQNCFNIIE